PVPSSETQREPTKLWQLAGKARQPAFGGAITWWIVPVVAVALAIYFVTNPGARLALAIAEGAILAFAAYWWLYRHPRPGPARLSTAPATPAAAQQKSLAVLPFANFSAEKDTDYLSDGLTEEITSALSRLAGLK